MTEELWTEVYNTVQEAVIKTIKEKTCKKAKWLSEEALQRAEIRREVKSKGEKERYIQLNSSFHLLIWEWRQDRLLVLSSRYTTTSAGEL